MAEEIQPDRLVERKVPPEARRPEWGLLAAILFVLFVTACVDEQHNYWHQPWESLKDITRQTSMLGIFALGAAVIIIAGGIDLSAGSVIAFSGSVCAAILVMLESQAMKDAKPLGLGSLITAVSLTIVIAVLIGSLHAWLITIVGLPPFVATLATLVGLRSLGRVIVERVTEAYFQGRSTQIQIFDARFRYLATNVQIPAAIFLILAVITWLVLSRTVLGRHIYALGGNEEAARLSGIETNRLKWLTYCVSAVYSALAGIIYICDNSVAAPQTLGRGYELNAIAAAVVGGCSLQGGVGTIPGAVLGAVFLRVVIDGIAKIIKTGADVYEGLIVGVVVVFAVALNQLRSAGKARKQFFPGAMGLVAVGTLALLAALMAAIFVKQSSWGTPTVAVVAGAIALAAALAYRWWESRDRA